MWNVWDTNAQNIFVQKSEKKNKRSPRITTRRWVDYINIDQEIGWEVVDWIDLAQHMYRWRDLVNTEMNFRVL
jgi:hypothetical protein